MLQALSLPVRCDLRLTAIQDVHLAEATIWEALLFSALLRQPRDVPMSEKYEYVERVITMLEMEDYAEAIIGSPGSGLNFEQRKWTTIGLELVAKPALSQLADLMDVCILNPITPNTQF